MGLGDLFKSKYTRMMDAYNEGLSYYNRRQYARALASFRTAAEGGITPACQRYGEMLFKGLGTAADPAAALPWFEKAAAADHYEALDSCARAYYFGRGTKPDYAKALEYARRSAQRQNIYGCYLYGSMLYFGHGTAPNYDEAKKYLEMACKKGDYDALHMLGRMYYEGKAWPKDFESAFRIFQRASESGNKNSNFRCGWMLQQGEGVTASPRTALGYYKVAAEQGILPAYINIGDIHTDLVTADGVLYAEEHARAALEAYQAVDNMEGENLNQAALKEACEKLCRLYDLPNYAANGVPEVFRSIIDPHAALDWMRTAARKDPNIAPLIPQMEQYVRDPDAFLARQRKSAAKAAGSDAAKGGAKNAAAGISDYRAGVLARRAGDAAKAQKLLEKAAAAGDNAARIALARLYLEAPGTPNVAGALAQYRAAVQNGAGEALLPLARLLLYRPGATAAEQEEGVALLKQAAETDDAEVQYLYACCLAEGRGSQQLIWLAGEWLMRAVQHGKHPGAAALLAYLCNAHLKDLQLESKKQEGEWTSVAMNSCRRAADDGLMIAQYVYGNYTLRGPYAHAAAVTLCEHAAAEGYIPAVKTCIAQMEGKGSVEGDEAVAAYWRQRLQRLTAAE